MAIALLGCTPPEVRVCNAAASLPPAEHLKACAALFDGEACHRYLLDLDGGLPSAHIDACVPEYCPRMKQPVRACAGERGTPATGHGVEFEFFSALFEVEYGWSAKAAEVAWARAAFRVYEEANAARRRLDADREARTRLVLELRGDWQSVVVESVRPPGGPRVELLPSALDPAQCGAFITASLDGGVLPPDAVARLRSEKKVQFKAIKCVMEALLDAGVAHDNIVFSMKPK